MRRHICHPRARALPPGAARFIAQVTRIVVSGTLHHAAAPRVPTRRASAPARRAHAHGKRAAADAAPIAGSARCTRERVGAARLNAQARDASGTSLRPAAVAAAHQKAMGRPRPAARLGWSGGAKRRSPVHIFVCKIAHASTWPAVRSRVLRDLSELLSEGKLCGPARRSLRGRRATDPTNAARRDAQGGRGVEALRISSRGITWPRAMHARAARERLCAAPPAERGARAGRATCPLSAALSRASAAAKRDRCALLTRGARVSCRAALTTKRRARISRGRERRRGAWGRAAAPRGWKRTSCAAVSLKTIAVHSPAGARTARGWRACSHAEPGSAQHSAWLRGPALAASQRRTWSSRSSSARKRAEPRRREGRVGHSRVLGGRNASDQRPAARAGGGHTRRAGDRRPAQQSE